MQGAKAFALIISACSAVASMAGQKATDVAPRPSARFPAAWYPPENDVTSTMAPVKGAPYDARMVMNAGQPGTPMAQEPLYARDSAGRTRTETIHTGTRQDGNPGEVREVEVNDAVTHCMFHWTEPWTEKTVPTATVSCMPRTLHYGAQPTWSSVASMQPGEEHPSAMETDHNESLGVRMFDGVRATGIRHTRIIQAAKTAKPTTTVGEFWVSTTMKEVVAMRVPPEGYILELRDIHLREPDAKLFYPPEGYKIESASCHP